MHSQKKAAPPKSMPSPSTDLDVEKNETHNHVDFLSNAYNYIDELDDTKENYREFENLSGVVTADMRFQALRRHLKESCESADTEPVAGIKHGTAEKSEATDEPESKPLIMVSEGRVVIVAAEEHKARDCAEILNKRGLCCSIRIVDDSRQDPWPPSSGAALDETAKLPIIHGYFGNFSVDLGDAQPGGVEVSTSSGRLSDSAGKNERCFDMVLDMRSRPSYIGKQLPLGYYAVGEDESALQSALEEMAEMKGRFSKPRLVALQPDRCIRDRHPQVQCDRCVRICPFAAIELEEGRLAVDYYKCQGCGACGLVCDAGAIESTHPRPEEFVADICGRLEEWTAVHTTRPHVILLDGQLQSTAPSSDFHAETFIHTVEEIGRLSIDVLAVLLAAGAGSVTVVCDKQRPAGLRRTLAEQIGVGQEILALLNLSADCLRLHVASREPAGLRLSLPSAPASVPESLSPATFDFSQAGSGGDRLRQAVDHFHSQQDVAAAALELSPGAPFGRLDVGADCSLCMACVGICPSLALSAGGNIPRLHFVEARCHQCGLCSAVCPEKAITLRPRLLVSVEAARSPVVICEVDAFHCIECGEPFAARSMVSAMQQSLAGHWMFKEERQQRRLQMCAACRTRDALLERGY